MNPQHAGDFWECGRCHRRHDYKIQALECCSKPNGRRELIGIWLFCLGICLATFWLSAWQGYMAVALILGAVIWWITAHIYDV